MRKTEFQEFAKGYKFELRTLWLKAYTTGFRENMEYKLEERAFQARDQEQKTHYGQT